MATTTNKRWGAHAVDGRMRPSEDRWVVKDLSGGRALVAVFDGHSGLFVVKKTAETLPDKILALWRQVGDDEAALRAGLRKVFLDHDRTLAQYGPLHYKDSGSTASIALVTGTSVIIAHVGDSPAFVMDATTGKIIQEIRNHVPTQPDESARILRNGGEVTQDEGDAPRVNGCLMVSRAFGDFALKFQNGRVPEMNRDWAKDFCVIAEPDIIVVPRPTKGLLAIMSDGLVESAYGDGLKPTADVATAIHVAVSGWGNNLEIAARKVIQGHMTESTDNPKEYDGDDLTLILMDISLPPVAVAPAVQKGGIGAFTRKARARRGAAGKTGKKNYLKPS